MLKLGISTCPNDTFIYENLIVGNAKLSREISVEYADVQTLNEKVLAGELDIAKISCAVFPSVADKYTLLKSGGAAGFGCGPLLLSGISEIFNPSEITYLPGKNTTAAMLFKFWLFKFLQKKEINADYLRFDDLYRKLCEKKITQGVTIHEHRFTYKRDNLHLVADLGEFWEKETHSAIPLGCSVVKKELGADFAEEVDLCIQKSLTLAWERKNPVTDFIRGIAQIDDDNIILSHIKMFVNEFSFDNKGVKMPSMKDEISIFTIMQTE
ncbi:1,4-dihydroxy-6-naphtoate synthase [Fibrobacterales bacterium]|nr:1,4-dihydroxy-6-naphtoate synthase [Fibrobacterales bacterium]